MKEYHSGGMLIHLDADKYLELIAVKGDGLENTSDPNGMQLIPYQSIIEI